MNYGNLFSKAWNIVWNHKFLIILGILVTLGGAGGSSGGSQSMATVEQNSNFQFPPQSGFNFSVPWQDIAVPALVIIAVLIGILLFIALWLAGLMGHGGLIFAADRFNNGDVATLGGSLGAAWKKAWRLIGIGLVPAIPFVLLMFGALISLGIYGNNRVISLGGEFIRASNIGFLIPLTITCILLPIALVLSLLRTFANRACMLEDLGVIASYRRGLEVLGKNLGPALVLFLLQIAISIGIWLVLLLPGILVALCCLLWPLLLLVQGTFAAFYSTLWTLAWNEWTGAEVVSLTE